MKEKIFTDNSSAVIESKGAELKSLVIGGKELMWKGDPAFWSKTSPVLFPCVGGVKGGKAMIDGVEYKMTKHGFARDNEFETERHSDTTVSFTLTQNEETLKMFPFFFHFTMHYKLLPDRLEIIYEVNNDSDIPMPFCIGAHPAFACESIDESRLVFQEKETVISPVLDAKKRLFKKDGGVWRLKNENEYKLSNSLFDNDVLYFRNIASKNVSLLDKSSSGVKISWNGFISLGVWTPAGLKAKFVCIEPWCGSDDFEDFRGDFRDKPEIQTCLPNASKFYSMIIEKI